MNERVGERVFRYLNGDTPAMQLATLKDDQPWICSVYFVADDDLNLYWLSLPSRRHSQEIASHSKVAAAIAVKLDQPIIGVQIEGVAEEVEDAKTVASVMKKYTSKYDMGEKFHSNFLSGSNEHRMYRLRPSLFVLMDEVNLKEEGRLEWRPQV